MKTNTGLAQQVKVIFEAWGINKSDMNEEKLPKASVNSFLLYTNDI